MEQQEDELGVFQKEPEDYGSKYGEYGEDLLDQYKLYVETTDRVSDRRNTANTFFLTANTQLVSVFGAIIANAPSAIASKMIWSLVFALSGVAFSLAWFFIVKSYGQLNSGKSRVIHEIEKKLPLALFKAEWKALGEGHNPKLYRPLTHIEIYAPLTFSLIYIIILILGLYPWLH